MDEIIKFPKLVDSDISSNIITLDNNLEVTKEKITKVNLSILENGKLSEIITYCDYPNLVNINYKLKSACNQIEESIKNINK
jgi:hypothetical protein